MPVQVKTTKTIKWGGVIKGVAIVVGTVLVASAVMAGIPAGAESLINAISPGPVEHWLSAAIEGGKLLFTTALSLVEGAWNLLGTGVNWVANETGITNKFLPTGEIKTVADWLGKWGAGATAIGGVAMLGHMNHSDFVSTTTTTVNTGPYGGGSSLGAQTNAAYASAHATHSSHHSAAAETTGHFAADHDTAPSVARRRASWSEQVKRPQASAHDMTAAAPRGINPEHFTPRGSYTEDAQVRAETKDKPNNLA
jgi:hypothetical protein